jgi:UDP-N-acetylglucosamine--N-acetylmuramyl-(pentapeptide) pyrophosphoryl-undecaprenol N-acetylglucosamine transferase
VKKKVLIAAGGTGGHLFPAQQLAQQLQGDFDLLFAGHQIGTSPFFEREKIPFAEIIAHPLKRGFFIKTCVGFWQACKLIRGFKPDLVVGFGSFHTVPLLLAAAFLRKKLVLFEANSKMGKVIRLFRPLASEVAVQFPNTGGTLVPWLPWKSAGQRLEMKEAKKLYGLDPEKKVVLVFGGSQGASFLNETAPKAIRWIEECQAIHLAGPIEAEKVKEAYEKLGIFASVKPFEKEMAHAYAAADLALCRSGAGTIAELIRFELPALLIPYPFASENHQWMNGEYLRDLGAARLIDQKEANEEKIAHELSAVIKQLEERKMRLRKVNAEDQKRTHLADIIRRIV